MKGTFHDMADKVSAGYLLATKKFADMFLDKNGVPIDNVETCFQGYESV